MSQIDLDIARERAFGADREDIAKNKHAQYEFRVD
jgi:hypothetical protein